MLRAFATLLLRELLRHPARSLSLLFASCAAAFALTAALTAALLVSGGVEDAISRLFPERRVLVRARPVDISFLRLEAGRLDDAALGRLRAQPTVERVLPQLSAAFPVSAIIEIPPGSGSGLATDAILHGAPRELLEGELAKGRRFDGAMGEPYPVVVSAFFLDLFNLGLAEASGLPKLSPAAVVGREFDLVLGSSTLAPSSGSARPRTVRCRVAGLTAQPALVGLTVPLETLAAWNAEFAPGRPALYAALHADARSAAELEALLDFVNEAGFRGEAALGTAERARSVAQGMLALAWLGAGLVGALAAAAVHGAAAGALRERRGSWGMMRALGAGRARVALLAASSTVSLC
ncbi:MAG: hypothetical protein SF028_15020, partial [Candidatus Sumerlaeia bacterium]|nr:hypothetical protein [Candidatus Sumerlaeia bacterium]